MQADLKDFVSEWSEWHAAYEDRRAAPHAFLSLTAICWLSSEPQSVPDIPGRWSAGPSGPIVDLDDGESLEIGGVAASGRYEFGPLSKDMLIDWGRLKIEVGPRGDQYIVRPRDPEAPLRKTYRGTPCFPADPKWRIVGTFLPLDEPEPIDVATVVDGFVEHYRTPGHVEFDIDGTRHRLTALRGHAPGSLTILFRDRTSGDSTYFHRVLWVDPPSATGEVVLDFNRAVNLPCSYSDFCTCPVPPAENRLDVAIEAGEKKPIVTR